MKNNKVLLIGSRLFHSVPVSTALNDPHRNVKLHIITVPLTSLVFSYLRSTGHNFTHQPCPGMSYYIEGGLRYDFLP